MTRSEHLQWCKDRTLKLCEDGDTAIAWASMVSDLRKHKQTFEHNAIGFGMAMVAQGSLIDKEDMKAFIEGFY